MSTRIQPELFGELFANRAVGSERVSLSAIAIQRGDQQCGQSFAERICRDESLQLTDHLARRSKVHARSELMLDQPQTHCFEMRPMRRQPLGIAGVKQALTAKHRKRGRTHPHGRGRVAGLAKRRGLIGHPGDF